jgi:putative membrane protein
MSDHPHDASLGRTDPSTYFAEERTFLAWIRTGLALMGVGFAVARFGLFLRQMSATEHGTAIQSMGASGMSGVAVVVVGVLVLAVSVLQHIHTIRRLRDGSWQPGLSKLGIALALVLLILGTLLAVYLLLLGG